MYKSIKLPEELAGQSIDDLREYIVSDWSNKYPHKCGMFLLDSQDKNKGKLIAQSGAKAYSFFLSRKKSMYDDDPDIIIVKGEPNN